jgi:hypothetical protein
MTDEVLAVDAAVRFAYNAELDEFKAAMCPKATEDYAMSKYKMMQKSLTAFWGALDEANRQKFVEAALARRARTVHD